MTRIQDYTWGAAVRRPAAWVCAFVASVLMTVPAYSPAQSQTAVVDDSIHPYINFSEGGGGPGGGSGIDGDGPPPLQPASMSATFSDFTLNGVSFADWQACIAAGGSAVSCNPGHLGEIGGDVFEFDLTIENTSGPGGPTLTNFAFQSKFSESPALGSRIGDKLFKATRAALATAAPHPLGGVKKNGTSNGLFGGKLKFICVNSSTDYSANLNAGTANETLECAGGRTVIFDKNAQQDRVQVVLQAADGSTITPSNIKVPKGLRPGESQTIRLHLDTSTDDGALQRAHAPDDQSLGPLTSDVTEGADGFPQVQAGGNVVEIVDFGDVKSLRDADGTFNPSFLPLSANQFLTVPRRNFGFSDILDTRDVFRADELPTAQPGVFSLLDIGDLEVGLLNFASMLFGYGEHGATLDPSCKAGGSQAGSCGGSPYRPFAEFYAIAGGKLVRQEVTGSYSGGTTDGTTAPLITASIDTAAGLSAKTEDPFEIPGGRNPGTALGASAMAVFDNFQTITDNPNTVDNEGGAAGGNKFRFDMTVTNTSPAGSDIYLTSINFQTKNRGLLDINDNLDGNSIDLRQDLRGPGATGQIPDCASEDQLRCFETALGIGRFPNAIGNSLLSARALSGLDNLRLRSIKKNGPFQPIAKGNANFICLKSGQQVDDQGAEDQDVVETCAGVAATSSGQRLGLAPGDAQTVRLELDYGDFRGLILRIAPGTLVPQGPPFGLVANQGDFDCRDQRRLPYCHPDLVGTDWFTHPLAIEDVIYLTVHQPGDAPTVMNFAQNFGAILAMAGFKPSAEFYGPDTGEGLVQEQVLGEYGIPEGGGQAPPDASFTFACTGLECTFTDTSTDSDGTIVGRSWAFGDGGSSTDQNPTHIYAAGGTYTVSLTVTDDDGAADTAEQTLTVTDTGNAEPTASFTFACQGLECQFNGSGSSDSDGQIEQYDWEFGDGTSGSGAVVSHAYASPGTYTVTLTVTDDKGATGTSSQSVTVEEPAQDENAVPDASFTFSCIGRECAFTDTSTDDGTLVAWLWDFGDGETSTGQNPTHTYRSAGNKAVSLTVTDDDGASDTAVRQVRVTGPPRR